MKMAREGAWTRRLPRTEVQAGAASLCSREAEDETPVGPYLAIEKLRQDLCSTTYVAAELDSDAVVALTVLGIEGPLPEELREAWMNWSHALATFQHPRVLSCYGGGITDDGRCYVAFEMHRGESLRDRLASGQLPFYETIVLLQQLLEALMAAHQLGIVHGDFRPEHVLCDAEGNVKISNLAFAECVRQGVLLERGALLAAPAYLSPEQVAGQSAKPSSDLYAFGLVAYECLFGCHPFASDGSWPPTDEMLLRQVQSTPAIGAAGPKNLYRLLGQILSKAPGRRTRAAAELLDTLRELSGGRSFESPIAQESRPAGEVNGTAETARFGEFEPNPAASRGAPASLTDDVDAVGARDGVVAHGASPWDAAGSRESRANEAAVAWGWPYGYMALGVLLGILLGVGVFLWQTRSLDDPVPHARTGNSSDGVVGRERGER